MPTHFDPSEDASSVLLGRLRVSSAFASSGWAVVHSAAVDVDVVVVVDCAAQP